jgi:hypothetical protein
MPDWFAKNQAQNYYSNLRLVISGNLFEFYRFNSDIMFGRRFKKKSTSEDEEVVKSTPPMTEEEKMLSSARRAKRIVSRLIRSNAFKWLDRNDKPYLPIVLTLTFKDEIRDVKTANSLFTDFIQRLNYSINLNERGLDYKEAKKNLLKYTAVIEFQDKNRDGVVHYHMIFFNLPKMKRIYDRLNTIWGKGYFWVGTKSKGKRLTQIDDDKKVKKIVEYFTKYITKSFTDQRLKNKKKHFNSRNLIKPIEVINEELVYMIDQEMPEEAIGYNEKQLMYKQGFKEKFFDYKKYDLSDFPDITKSIQELLMRYQNLEVDNKEKIMIE